LSQFVPVELRYETIVLEDGQLHIYRDVYDQDTNTEANLRAVLDANGMKLEDLGEAERAEVLEAVNAMSRHPLKQNLASRQGAKSANSAVTSASPADKAKGKKLIGKNQKEIVIELAALKGKGYRIRDSSALAFLYALCGPGGCFLLFAFVLHTIRNHHRTVFERLAVDQFQINLAIHFMKEGDA